MVGEVIAGRYELEELVGTGGMSSVYRAHDRMLERRVALKILHEQFGRDGEYVERFRREARSVAQLTHPNIVTVIDRGEQDARQFIVFELVDGENLKELVVREGPLSVDEALGYGLQIGRALAFAHQQGLVHRDVKPQNVLLNADGRARVTDFGIARSLDAGGLTMTGTVVGTSHYIAPEQARGEQVGDQTDIYSLGVVLYELLVGEPPYQGESFVAVAMQHVNAPIPSVRDSRPDVPVRLDAAIERAMAKDPADRFESMDDFVAELEGSLAELHHGAGGAQTMILRPRPAGPVSQLPGRQRRVWPFVAAALAVLAAAGAVAAALALRHDGGKKHRAAPPRPVRLLGVSAYDPQGTNGEHDADAPKATDGNRSTYWYTETYRTFTKSGVGLVLDAGRRISPRRLTVTSDTPGFTAEIRAGNLKGGPFDRVVGPAQTVSGVTTYRLSPARSEFLLVWITDLGSNGSVRVNEVRAR